MVQNFSKHVVYYLHMVYMVDDYDFDDDEDSG